MTKESNNSYGREPESRNELPSSIPYDYMVPRAHFSERYGFLYIDTPKVACSTIKSTIRRAELDDRQAEVRPHRRADLRTLLRRLLGREPAGTYSDHLLSIHDRSRSPLKHPAHSGEFNEMLSIARFTFCFVRNPYTRALSAFLDKIDRRAPHRNAYLSELDPTFVPGGKEVTFNAFLRLVGRQSVASMNEHWRPQHIHIRPDLIGFDAVGSFESISHDLERILCDIHPALPSYIEVVDEHATKSREKLKSYYDADSVRIVQGVYEQDFLLYGYSFDLASASDPPDRFH